MAFAALTLCTVIAYQHMSKHENDAAVANTRVLLPKFPPICAARRHCWPTRHAAGDGHSHSKSHVQLRRRLAPYLFPTRVRHITLLPIALGTIPFSLGFLEAEISGLRISRRFSAFIIIRVVAVSSLLTGRIKKPERSFVAWLEKGFLEAAAKDS